MSKHTPGPWRAITGGVECDDGHLCTMEEYAEAQADARLIAAAPDMYEALPPDHNVGEAIEALEHVCDLRNSQDGTVPNHAIDRLTDAVHRLRLNLIPPALAKAEGRS